MRRLILLAVGVLSTAACSDPDALSAQDSAFVATMVELRKLERGGAADSAARDAVLRRRGVARDSLERAARALAAHPARAAAVWSEIERRSSAADAVVAPVAPAATPVRPP